MRNGVSGVMASLAVGALALAPVPAAATAAEEAEQLRRLDIMLMVTNLRCTRQGESFSAEYQRFTSAHLTTLNAAGRQLQAQHGGGRRTLDRLSTAMANQYGLGHPWLSCVELRGVADRLAGERSRAVLLTAAGEVLAADRPGRVAMVASYTLP